jgi:hypothetical protein
VVPWTRGAFVAGQAIDPELRETEEDRAEDGQHDRGAEEDLPGRLHGFRVVVALTGSA